MVGETAAHWAGSEEAHSSDGNNGRLTMFLLVALAFQELLTNKGFLGVQGFLLLNKIYGAKGQE